MRKCARCKNTLPLDYEPDRIICESCLEPKKRVYVSQAKTKKVCVWCKVRKPSFAFGNPLNKCCIECKPAYLRAQTLKYQRDQLEKGAREHKTKKRRCMLCQQEKFIIGQYRGPRHYYCLDCEEPQREQRKKKRNKTFRTKISANKNGKKCGFCGIIKQRNEYQDYRARICISCRPEFEIVQKQRHRIRSAFTQKFNVSIADVAVLGDDWLKLALKVKQEKTKRKRKKGSLAHVWEMELDEFLKAAGIEVQKGETP